MTEQRTVELTGLRIRDSDELSLMPTYTDDRNVVDQEVVTLPA